MNRARLSIIAHRDHIFANPVSKSKIDRALSLLEVGPGDQVLDVGCGNAELLIRLIELHDIVGVGVDPSLESLATGRQRARGRILAERLRLHPMPIADFVPTNGVFTAALCVGATHAYGDYERTLGALKSAVGPGGQLLIGEGYWKRPPDPDYLALLDTTVDELTDHAGNVSRAVRAGLTPLYTAASSDDEWDHYEGLYCRAVERYVATHPDDPEGEEFKAYIRRWYAGYLRWGRQTLGFGLYLLRT